MIENETMSPPVSFCGTMVVHLSTGNVAPVQLLTIVIENVRESIEIVMKVFAIPCNFFQR